ncbi:MAG: hypothetical protein WBW71_08175 [Bacteroidota bacterium]
MMDHSLNFFSWSDVERDEFTINGSLFGVLCCENVGVIVGRIKNKKSPVVVRFGY